MTEHLVVGTEISDQSPPAPREKQILWFVLAAVGVAVGGYGWYGLGGIWISADLGNLSWEFDAIASTFYAMVLPTVGFALLAVGLFRNHYEMACKAVAILLMAVAAFLAGILVIYAVDLPAALQDARASGIAPEFSPYPTMALGAGLVILYGWGAWYLRSRTRHIY